MGSVGVDMQEWPTDSCFQRGWVCVGAHRDTVQFKEQLQCSVVYRTGSQNSVNPRISLCSARVRFRDSANVSPSSAGLPKRKYLFPKKETNAPVTKMNENAI